MSMTDMSGDWEREREVDFPKRGSFPLQNQIEQTVHNQPQDYKFEGGYAGSIFLHCPEMFTVFLK
jgi:hypothetical protein